MKDDVAAWMRTQIFECAVHPREQLDLDRLERTLGVSRQPIREAVVVLEEDGLVTTVPRRGTFVADITRRDLEDHVRMVAALTSIVARRGVGHVDLQAARVRTDEPDAGLTDLLTALFVGAGSEYGIEELRRLGRIVPGWTWSYLGEGRREVVRAKAGELVTAVRDVDAERVERVVDDLFLLSGDALIAHLDALGFWAGDPDDVAAEEGIPSLDGGSPAAT